MCSCLDSIHSVCVWIFSFLFVKKGEFFGPIILFEEQCKIAPYKSYFLASKFWKSVAAKIVDEVVIETIQIWV